MRSAARRTWIDATVPITDGMVRWPDDPPVHVRRTRSLDAGGSSNVTHLDLAAHTGTHLDAPSHFLPGAPDLDAFAPRAMIGRARVLAIAGRGPVTRAHLARHTVRPGHRVLLRTQNSARPWWRGPFRPDYVHLSPDAAGTLAARRPLLVGIDGLSVDPYPGESAPAHRALLGAGAWILEGLDLSRVPPGAYDMACLPLRVAGSDGAPARVLLRPRLP